MTMFKTNEKLSEPLAANKTPERDVALATAPKRNCSQASAQPLAKPAMPVVSTSQPMSTPSVRRWGPRMTSVISKALKITGQLESTEDIQIEGQMDGDVRGVTVRVGAGAKIKGSVYGDEVELAGSVDGKIEAKKVILTTTARMSGDVVHQDIKIESGAFLDGHCRPEYGKSETAPVCKNGASAGVDA